ncbi:tRNA threonylcarbamoyladenosine dehydratase [Candidatus Thioglobus sp.]|jgi:tRNA A37 threonylcarbamoyladenosine dehydratase|uniref:tRNA threonylcarbamoyladenosine dehydratase n=1 Tax=Candidatus Thioglobus sp. TaxID=2026721 RepID=UPI001DE6D66F|nr:tRNA threonylcarbamoyladenosine dehydratase [Candidatus Thioglobus sp.]MBT3277247.1 tRNA threonylcarbamoyladenosine dehydratase [Candidatus Thioglobus sp.]MBT4001128.1 tRNA threonylcarbamoyladenosine dehydratase [Candidatus Thioglobus sp.]MBT4746485.1 tRNA threonylcarbamoyladenosine dehydratase [Candidatus Thioglobus sp.]MBT5165027.1 tRNA threonylcarbamoyladenosine dehydratase [Candidatus Thioglobus sp.]MBT6278804.1 tRNA threonylcarbamoyladenosine dehydratase [Candidatus Thioglobus sp.]
MAGSCARTEILLGQQGLARLAESHVVIAGLGGVGGACAEALCRAGVGTLTLIDFDIIETTDLNRQIVALNSTLGLKKVNVLADRLRDINPDTVIIKRDEFIDGEKSQLIALNNDYHFVADCIDAISCKTALIDSCNKSGKLIISSMGAGGRLDPTQVKISRMDKTQNCALAREMRRRLRNIHASMKFPVVHSTELPIKALPHKAISTIDTAPSGRPRAVNGAISYMPNIFGLIMAGHIVQTLLKS